MATQKETVEFILGKLRERERFTARALFGKYALYADGKGPLAVIRVNREIRQILETDCSTSGFDFRVVRVVRG